MRHQDGLHELLDGQRHKPEPAADHYSNSPYDQTGTNPAQSNCDSKTGCANYSTGDQTKTNPAQPMQQHKK